MDLLKDLGSIPSTPQQFWISDGGDTVMGRGWDRHSDGQDNTLTRNAELCKLLGFYLTLNLTSVPPNYLEGSLDPFTCLPPKCGLND